MKKGEKLLTSAYLLQVNDIHNTTVGSGVYRSLRQAVLMANKYVENMDAYHKVYHQFKGMQGAYAGVFFPWKKKRTRHLFVLISLVSLPSIEIEEDMFEGGLPDEPLEGE